MVELILKVVKSIVGFIVIVSWAIVGFILWLPLLTRMMAYFTGFVAAASFRKLNLSHAKDSLNFAIEFYINGFRRILIILGSDSIDPAALPTLKNDQPTSLVDFLKSIAADIIWAIIFWAFIGIQFML